MGLSYDISKLNYMYESYRVLLHYHPSVQSLYNFQGVDESKGPGIKCPYFLT